MSERGGGRPQSLAGVLARLTDPATSTRRTDQARRRLAEDPVTLALLEAGVLVLQRELGTLVPSTEGDDDAEDDRRSLRFFELLSASRVCAAATAVGPLRVTPSHLRDRWARQRDYGEDLLAFLLRRRQWDDLMHQRLQEVAPPTTPEQVPGVARALAEAHLVPAALPVSTRLQLVASALASEHPGLRRAREENHRQAARRWAEVWARCAEAVGCRAREGADLGEVASALAAVTEGADLRLLASDGSPEHVEESVRLLTAAELALVRRSFEPDPGTGTPAAAPGGREPLWPRPGEADTTDVADVLVHLTDPVTGTRRTSAARHRLAHDEITAQLLHGGTGVLGQELGVVASGPGHEVGAAPTATPPRFFGLLSAAAVEAAGRSLPGGGPGPTAAQLRDRWRTQDDDVDDLLAYAAHRVLRVRQGVLRRIRADALAATSAGSSGVPRAPGAGGVPPHLEAALVAAAARVVDEVDAEGHDRLRLLLTALGAARPSVAERLSRMREQEEQAVTDLLAELLARTGARLRDDVPTADLARAVVALRDGLVVRALATGGLDGRAGSTVPSLARSLVEVVAGCVAGP